MIIINKVYLGDITATNIYKSFTHKMAAIAVGIDVERNYVTVTLCIVMTVRRISFNFV